MLKSTTPSGRLWERKGKKFLISLVTGMYVNQNATFWRVFPGGTYYNADYWAMGHFWFSVSYCIKRKHQIECTKFGRYLGWSDLKCSLRGICRIHFGGFLGTLQRTIESISSAAETEVQWEIEDRKSYLLRWGQLKKKKSLSLFTWNDS